MKYGLKNRKHLISETLTQYFCLFVCFRSSEHGMNINNNKITHFISRYGTCNDVFGSVGSYFLVTCCVFKISLKLKSNKQKTKQQNLLLILLDVADVVAAHCACPHVTDERKQLIFCIKESKHKFN